MPLRIVWILGSGASVGLGGPTLASLLSGGTFRNLQARYLVQTCPNLFDTYARLVHRLYQAGRRWPDGRDSDNDREPGEVLWAHAEEFLDYLDTAAHSAADHGGPYGIRLALTAQRWLRENGLPPGA